MNPLLVRFQLLPVLAPRKVIPTTSPHTEIHAQFALRSCRVIAFPKHSSCSLQQTIIDFTHSFQPVLVLAPQKVILHPLRPSYTGILTLFVLKPPFRNSSPKTQPYIPIPLYYTLYAIVLYIYSLIYSNPSIHILSNQFALNARVIIAPKKFIL